MLVDDCLKTAKLLLLGLDTLHRAVVDATHAESVESIHACSFVKALSPIVYHIMLIGDEIEWSTLLLVPFANIIAQHRFAMR